MSRRLHTTLPVERVAGDAGAVVIRGRRATYRVTAGGTIALAPAIRWPAYGQAEPATAIAVAEDAELPWSAAIRIEAT